MTSKIKIPRQHKCYGLYPDESDDRIAELEREIATLHKKLRSKKEDDKFDLTELNSSITLQKEIDVLEGALRKQKREYADLEEEAALLRTEVDMLNKAMYMPSLKEENLVETMMHQLEARTEELHMTRTLIIELQNVAFSEHAEDNVVALAKSVMYENDQLKKQLMHAEIERLKCERKLNETEKHSDLMERAYEKQKKFIHACKAKMKEMATEKQGLLEELEQEFQKKEALRLAREKHKFELVNMQLNDLQSRLNVAEMACSSGAKLTLPPVSPQNSNAILIANLRSDIETKDELITSLKLQLGDIAFQSDRSSSSVKKFRLQKMKSAELENKNIELQGENKLLKEQLKTFADATTEEINTLQQQKQRLLGLLSHFEADSTNAVMIKHEMETQSKMYQKKLQLKEQGVEKLHAALKSLSTTTTRALEENAHVAELNAKLQELTKENARILKDYHAEVLKRKLYYNLAEEVKGKIRVFARARPLLTSSCSEKNAEMCLEFPDRYTLFIHHPKTPKEFVFDRVFQPEEGQAVVFEETKSLLRSALDGYCVSIFAYGQTGSGKTYTLLGENAADQEGIAPRSFNHLFQVFEEEKDQYEYKTYVSMVELYNDQIIDLLRKKDSPDNLEIKKDCYGYVVVQGAERKSATSAEEMMKLYKQGISTRHVSQTNMNLQSSRSHLMIMIFIEGLNKTSRQISMGKLAIVDLAGSERVSKSNVSPKTLKEANAINLSLSALGDVICALTSEQDFIPYRNNKLTLLLQDALGGNAKSLMFLNVTPSSHHSNETLYSLSYGARVKLIKNISVKSMQAEQVQLLEAEVESLKNKVALLKEELFFASAPQ